MIRRSKNQWRDLFDEHVLSGLTAAEFCRSKSINPKYFSLRKRELDSSSESFVKVAPSRPIHQEALITVRITEFEVPAPSLNESLSVLLGRAK